MRYVIPYSRDNFSTPVPLFTIAVYLWRRTCARNVSFRNSSRWPIYIIKSLDKNKITKCYPHRHSKSVSLATDPIYYHNGLAAINLRHLQYCLLLICFRIIRAPDRDLFHQYHDKKCDPSLSEEQYRSCLGSKAKVEGTHTQIAIQLTKLREKYEPESQSENGYWDQTIERNKCQPVTRDRHEVN